MSQASLVFVSWPAPAIQSTPSWSIVSWAGESWSWPLWGVFQAPHVGFMSIWTLLAWVVGPMAPSLKDTAKQGFNYNQMQHCPPRSSVLLCVRSSSDSHAVSGWGCVFVCLFVRGQSESLMYSQLCFNPVCQLMPWHRLNIWLCISANVRSICDLRIIHEW